MELVHSVVRSLPLRPEATSKKRPLRELCFSQIVMILAIIAWAETLSMFDSEIVAFFSGTVHVFHQSCIIFKGPALL